MVQSKLIKTCLVHTQSFDDLIALIKVSCLELQYDESTVIALLELLIQNKDKLVSSKNERVDAPGNTSLMQSLEE